MNIAAVERDTGLAKDTLRVWERRYGFPVPDRDDKGERVYPLEQVERLRLIRRLLDQGKRPSAIVGTDREGLARLLDESCCASDDEPQLRRNESFLQLVRLHRITELRAALQQALLKQGLQRFVADTVASLNEAVGQAWMRGEVDVPEEHLYTEQVQNVLRNAIGAQAGAAGRPRILLTTFPDEQHSLGLLMAQAMLVPEAAACVSLGTQTPIADIRGAATTGGFDVVALSFSAAFPVRRAVEGLTALRELLPPQIALWAGGAAVRDRDKRLPGIRVIGSLDDALAALAEWRADHPAG